MFQEDPRRHASGRVRAQGRETFIPSGRTPAEPLMTTTTLPRNAEELLAAITDPTGPDDAKFLCKFTDRMAKPHLVNKKDVVFTRLITRFMTQVFPAAVALYLLPGWWALAAGVPYLVFVFLRFAGPVMLGLHAVTHRPLFRKPYRGLSKFITHLFPPFLGLTPFAYQAHHVVMHHRENNGDDDLSGTAEYQRDSLLHFTHYWFRFFAFAYVHMASYMLRRGKKGQLAGLLIGDTLCWVFFGVLAWFKPAATLMVFIMPFLIMRLAMMAGNWTEHAFVDVEDPTNSYTNSINLINTPYNHITFNAGYHLIHHIVPGRHWASTVAAFEKYLPKMIEERSVLFYEVPDVHVIWFKLMIGDYGYLADHLLDLGGQWPTREDKIAFLRERAQSRRGELKGLLELREARPAAA